MAGGGLAKLLFAIGFIGGAMLRISIGTVSLVICGYFWASRRDSEESQSNTINGSVVSAIGIALVVVVQFLLTRSRL